MLTLHSLLRRILAGDPEVPAIDLEEASHLFLSAAEYLLRAAAEVCGEASAERVVDEAIAAVLHHLSLKESTND